VCLSGDANKLEEAKARGSSTCFATAAREDGLMRNTILNRQHEIREGEVPGPSSDSHEAGFDGGAVARPGGILASGNSS
jgi:hypothetical protein